MESVMFSGKYAMMSLRSLAQGTANETGVIATVLAMVASFGTVANTVLLLVLLMFMSLDFLVAIGRAYRSPVERFSGDKFFGGLVGKMMRLAVIAIASGLDMAFSVTFPLSGDIVNNYTPVTKAALCWLIVGEGLSIINHIRASEGEDVIPAVIIRALDRLKLGGKEPPTRRIYDREAIEGTDPLRQLLKPESDTQNP